MNSDKERCWAEVGRSLTQAELEQLGADIKVSFHQTAGKVARGEEIKERDIRELYTKLDEARLFINEIAAVAPNSHVPNLANHMTDEERRLVAARAGGIDAETGDSDE